MSRSHHHLGNAKIYKIVIGEYYYFGSTRTSPSERLYCHKAMSMRYPDRKLYKHITLAGGWDNVKMIVVERFPCDSREELQRKEDSYIREHLSDEHCLNEIVAYRSPEERREIRGAAQRARRATLSPEEKEARRIRHNELQRLRRAARPPLSDEEKEARRAYQREYMRARRERKRKNLTLEL